MFPGPEQFLVKAHQEELLRTHWFQCSWNSRSRKRDVLESDYEEA